MIVDAPAGVLLDCSPDGRWLVRIGTAGFVLTATDGKTERLVAPFTTYATRGEKAVQFGEDGRRLYFLSLDRRTIDVVDGASGTKLHSIMFDLAPADQIEGFSFSPDGSRVLLTTGGDRNDLWMAVGFARPATSWRRWFGHWESPMAAPAP